MDRAVLALVAISMAIAISIPLAIYLLYPEEASALEDVIEYISNESSPYIRESPRFVKGVAIAVFGRNVFGGRGYIAVDRMNRIVFRYDETSIDVVIGRSYIDISTGRVIGRDMLIHILSSGNNISVKGYVVETPRGRVLVPIEIVVNGHIYVVSR